MRMSREERLERERGKREAWQRELGELHRIRDRREEQSAKVRRHNERYVAQIREIHERMRQAEFRLWYEATTGLPLADFLRRVVVDPGVFAERYPKVNQLDWTKAEIEQVAETNRWRDSEYRALWTEEVLATIESHARRLILMKLATPRWADMDAIMSVYLERDRVTEESGVRHHVDHIVPIQHHLVCGLHCEANLRVITARDNIAKNNRFEIA